MQYVCTAWAQMTGSETTSSQKIHYAYAAYSIQSDEFIDLLVPVFKQSIKVLHAGGCGRFIIYSVAPTGCLPFSKTMAAGSFTGKCVDRYNQEVIKHNSKIQQALLSLKRKLDIKTTYVDLYRLLVDAVYNPIKYGFTESSRGCCGTGTFEGAILCNPLSPICSNVSKYIFWDAVHPTEKFYKILADQTMESLSNEFFM